MLILKLAYKNIIGAGLRTWLNVIALSFSFVAIIWTQGLYKGMGDEASRSMVEYQIGGGQYWVENFDPFDALTIEDAHRRLPAQALGWVAKGKATPILIRPGSIYPGGRLIPVMLKGIDPRQTILKIPTAVLSQGNADLPLLIGSRIARQTGLHVGDEVALRWRDVNGAFDALDGKIVKIMHTKVSTVDNGQAWLPLKVLQKMTQMENEATKLVLGSAMQEHPPLSGWVFKSQWELLKDIRDLVKQKSAGASVLYAVLLFLAMLAIFDTQVLSIWRRRKEIGTLMALGMTRLKVILLFTVEGFFHGILATLAAAVYGLPLLIYFTRNGYPLPDYSDSFGLALSEKLYPVYSASLIVGTVLLILIVVTIVSYIPTRRIAHLKPTDALRGKIS